MNHVNARCPAVLVCIFSLGALAMAVDATAQSAGGRIDQGAVQIRQQSSVAEERAAAIEQALEGLRADLILIAEQVPAWESFANKVRVLERDVPQSQPGISAEFATKVGRQSDAQVASARSREVALEDVSRAARALFAVLVREQRLMAATRVGILSRRLIEGTTVRIRDGAATPSVNL